MSHLPLFLLGPCARQEFASFRCERIVSAARQPQNGVRGWLVAPPSSAEPRPDGRHSADVLKGESHHGTDADDAGGAGPRHDDAEAAAAASAVAQHDERLSDHHDVAHEGEGCHEQCQRQLRRGRQLQQRHRDRNIDEHQRHCQRAQSASFLQ